MSPENRQILHTSSSSFLSTPAEASDGPVVSIVSGNRELVTQRRFLSVNRSRPEREAGRTGKWWGESWYLYTHFLSLVYFAISNIYIYIYIYIYYGLIFTLITIKISFSMHNKICFYIFEIFKFCYVHYVKIKSFYNK